nr:hypothetical protein [Tanacetum cinerariifolium]
MNNWASALASSYAPLLKNSKKKKRNDSPKTPPGSPPHQPPPPLPQLGPSGTSRSSRDFGSLQVPPLPSPPPSTSQEGQSHGSTTSSSSKTTASAEYTTWMTSDTRFKPSLSSIPKDLHMDDDLASDEQYQMEECQKLLTDKVDDALIRIEVLSLYGYDYMKKIVLRRADLKEYIIAEKDLKYLYPSDFEDLPNGEALRKCILSGPYKPITILVQAIEATDDSPAIPKHTTVETPMNMSPENKAYFLAGKEAIHLILTGIGDEIYSTVDACQIAQEMWEAIERLQQGESQNIQDVKTNLFWEFGKFTSHDGEPMESYYTRFYKLMNEMIKNNLIVTTILARNANPLALVATAQANQDPYYQTSRHKGKEIAKLITPLSETASEEDNDPEQAQRDKDMQKNLALIVKYFKKIYEPTNNNLRTSLNSRNKNVDTTSWYKNDDHSGQFGNQRTVNVTGAREKECKKPKRVKDFVYHKEKMLLCKQAEQGVPLQAEHYDWLADMDEEVDKQELEAHYNYMVKIQEVPTADTGTDSEPVEHVQNDAGYNVFANDLQ